MSKQKTTPWFDGNVYPVRVGVYQTPDDEDDCNGVYYSYFDGLGFCGQCGSVKRAVEKASTVRLRAHWRKSGSPVYQWRGLTAPAKEAAHG